MAAIVSAIAGAHVATPWLVVGALVMVLIIVFTAYAKAAKERDALAVGPWSVAGVPSPNPMTVLQWDGRDYQPQEAKAWRGPKMFLGPTDPKTIPGVVANDRDTWHRSAS